MQTIRVTTLVKSSLYLLTFSFLSHYYVICEKANISFNKRQNESFICCCYRYYFFSFDFAEPARGFDFALVFNSVLFEVATGRLVFGWTILGWHFLI